MFATSTHFSPGAQRACPRCGDHALRVRRRLIDRVLHPLVPVRRYRCISTACSWVGNLKPRPRPAGQQPAGDAVLDSPRGSA